jgi:ATP-dependent RNA helicase RhlE
MAVKANLRGERYASLAIRRQVRSDTLKKTSTFVVYLTDFDPLCGPYQYQDWPICTFFKRIYLNFSELELHPALLEGIDALNYVTATPIQAQAIPIILDGRDLIGVAQTGTGKTAAFVLPMLDLILKSGEDSYIQALVIVPTRELAMQIEKVIEAYAYFTGVSSIAVYGGGDGKEFSREKNAISQGVDVIIATPGRLIAHMNMGYVNFKDLRFLVLDEADRMLDMGFQPDLLTIIGKVNPQRQTLLFSATMPPNVLKFAKTLLKDPAQVSIALSKPAEGVEQIVYLVNERDKLPLMYEVLKGREGERIIVFCSSKLSVAALYRSLRAKRFAIEQISSDLEQTQREKVMLDFRNRRVDILVATDVLSRGIDVDGIDLVVNFDVPRDAEDYVHRIGRTARAGEKGTAITLITPQDNYKFKKIESLIGRTIEKKSFGTPIDPNEKPARNGDPRRRPPQGKPHPHKKQNTRPGPEQGNGAQQPANPADAAATDAVKKSKSKSRRNRRKKKGGSGQPVQNPESTQ